MLRNGIAGGSITPSGTPPRTTSSLSNQKTPGAIAEDIAVAADVSNEADVTGTFHKAISTFGGLDGRFSG